MSIRSSSPARQEILEVKNISKEFVGVKALNHVSLNVVEVEIHRLVGENGLLL